MNPLPSPKSRQPRVSRALFISLSVHLAVLVVLIAFLFGMWVKSRGGSSGGAAEMNVAGSPAPLRFNPPLIEESPRLLTPEEALEAKIDGKIDDSLQEAAAAPVDENKERLADLSNQLQQFATDKGLDEVSEKFQGWTDTQERATQPAAEPAVGEFDHDTAQVHDVIREPDGQGGFKYRGIMLDAAGRTQEVELDAATGASLYDTLQMVKANPLLEKVYRQISMPMLHKMLREEEPPAEELEAFEKE